jgi:Predicted metal binding domain
VHELASRELFGAQAVGFTPEFAAGRGWVLHAVEYPVVDVCFTSPGRTALRVRFRCDEWNGKPPSIEVLREDGTPHASPWPPNANPSGVFHQGPHPTTGRPFICMRGSREYHSHSSHAGDLWDNHRSHPDNTLGGLLHQVWRAWLKGSD